MYHYNFLVFIFAFIISLILAKTSISILKKYAVLDIPIARSNHKKATPSGGGISIVITIISSLLGYYFIFSTDTDYSILYFSLSIILVATVSFIDDLKCLSIPTRLVVQFIAIFFLMKSFPGNFGISKYLFLFEVLFLFINFYNFMDGIDGSASSEAIHISLSVFIITLLVGENSGIPEYVQYVSVVLCGACLAFIIFNWHPAKVFLGDIGSISIGLICGWMLMHLALNSYIAAAIIIPLYYISDSGITILKRMTRGEKIWQAHSEHFFQKAVRKGKSHSKVTKKIIINNMLLLVLALISLSYPVAALVAACILVSHFLYRLQKNYAQTK